MLVGNFARAGACSSSSTASRFSLSTTTSRNNSSSTRINALVGGPRGGPAPARAGRTSSITQRFFAADASNPVHAKIGDLVKKNSVLLFMKGNPIFPQCGFSRTVCEVLRREGFEGQYESVNVLENEDIRENVKTYSDWPTIPQLYVNGEFVGGCDIVLDMHRQGELKDVLAKVGGTAGGGAAGDPK
mmetsp:Transcript_5278/g.13352  ORF Transcript_5278/g.13352 Transcript_5278/m.13352 type:complete len:187 (-) Transcript_5278:2547-3107(-)